ncbi:Etoposide-induced protein 2.4 homolog [Strongyloides ratti]|uniref:Etoposide-induced protein 2.4 homolog n=1 Tax=Strongyloides ratti TaxID=34506 RepID=A0A090LFZ9_STRRB|nr:Etoposide-induced protein 2.4 homolog [Strongyloides ratti]CEF67078.1 Etoposide-induced protein 2.4 homolog [Strongyloides ratti]
MAINFFRVFVWDFLEGVKCSVKGFFVIRELDRVTHIEPKTKEKKEIKTVLSERRRVEAEKKDVVSPKKPSDEVPVNNMPIWQRILKIISYNLLSVFVITIIQYICEIFKSAEANGSVLAIILTVIIHLIGYVPIIFTRILSILWHSDVSNTALRYRGVTSSDSSPFSVKAADFIFTIVFELIFNIQTVFLKYFPCPVVINNILIFIHSSLLNSLYSFEYYWMALGWNTQRRIATIENSWPYFVGFGAILAFASTFSESTVINGCIFASLFPFFIISGYLNNFTPARREIPSIPIFKFSFFIADKLSYRIFGSLKRAMFK